MNFKTENVVIACILLGFIASATNTVFSQRKIIDEVTHAIEAGDAGTLSDYFSEQIYFTLYKRVQRYSKTQAQYVLKNFFEDNPPAEFHVLHRGESKGGLRYAIGEYSSTSDHYRVLIRISDTEKGTLIHEVCFIKEES